MHPPPILSNNNTWILDLDLDSHVAVQRGRDVETLGLVDKSHDFESGQGAVGSGGYVVYEKRATVVVVGDSGICVATDCGNYFAVLSDDSCGVGGIVGDKRHCCCGRLVVVILGGGGDVRCSRRYVCVTLRIPDHSPGGAVVCA